MLLLLLLQGGLGWLVPQDGGPPPLGWHDTATYLVLPVLLTISQVRVWGGRGCKC